MKRVILESPYAGNIERNIRYARACVRDSLLRGEAPIASHLLYTQEGILRDEITEERQHGIDAGLAWKDVADLHVFYIDLGMSKGMQHAMKFATEHDVSVEQRHLDGIWNNKVDLPRRVLCVKDTGAFPIKKGNIYTVVDYDCVGDYIIYLPEVQKCEPFLKSRFEDI